MNPTTTPHKLMLSLTRVIRAPRSRVFAAFTSLEELKKWLGPGECHLLGGELDFRPGGNYRLRLHTQMPDSGGEADVVGKYEEVVRNERIRFTWSWHGSPTMEAWGETRVTFQFADHADGTQVTLTHEGFINEQARAGHNHGWVGSLDKLAASVDEARLAKQL